MKDINFKEINNDIKLLKLTETQCQTINLQIKNDCGFLTKHNLMDYSVLLVVEQVP